MMGGQDIAQQRGENALKPRNTFLLLVLNNSVTLVMSHKFLQAQTSQKGTKMPSSKEQHVCVCVCGFVCVCAKSLQSCLSLCDPMNCSVPGSSVHGVHQARILHWVAIPSSRGSSQPTVPTCIPYISCIGMWVLYH